MSDALVARGPQNNAVSVALPDEKLQLLKRVLKLECDNDTLMFYGELSHRLGLDPFRRQIYLIMRFNKQTGKKEPSFQTGIDGYRAIAARTGEYVGQDEPVHDNENAKQPRWSKVTVYRQQNGCRVAYTGVARWDEYVQDNNPIWRKMPYTMLDKCAEVQAIRRAFPETAGLDLEGTLPDEIDEERPVQPTASSLNQRVQAQAPKPLPPAAPIERRVSPPVAPAAPQWEAPDTRDVWPTPQQPQEPEPAPPPPPPAAPAADTVRDQWGRAVAKFAEIGVQRHELMEWLELTDESQVTPNKMRRAADIYNEMTAQPAPS